MIATGRGTLTKKQEEVYGILTKVMEAMTESNSKGENMGETFKYIMDPEEFADLLAKLDASGEQLEKHMGDKDKADFLVRLACLIIGYHLGTNKMKEVN